MSDPESMMIGMGLAFGSFRLPKVSVACAPRKEHPGGRAECF